MGGQDRVTGCGTIAISYRFPAGAYDTNTDALLTANSAPRRSISCVPQKGSTRVNVEIVGIPILDGAVAGGDDAEHPARLVVGDALGSFSEAHFL